MALIPDGRFDVKSVESDGSMSRLLYAPYEGPPRMNNLIGTPHWDVFPAWNTECPRAVELAEVYSLGAAMFLILEEVGLEHIPGVEDYATAQICWTEKAVDIPERWRDAVDKCVRQDSNERMGMQELLKFWEGEIQRNEIIAHVVACVAKQRSIDSICGSRMSVGRVFFPLR